ncbi:MAG: pro-sigmaK processing inhibitor BofA family protein [Eubacteriales bacterium]|nr:pro-sigmaK processing inhibitor BofA family protein [Eubacteriales bacterium]
MSLFIVCLIAFIIGVAILKIVCTLFKVSAKILIKLIGNAIIGALMLLAFNFLGGMFGLSLALTPFNSLLVGILGIPGVILLLILG